MFEKCANPECGRRFDYLEGQLIRFCRSAMDGLRTANEYVVEHFWLCGNCSEVYILEQKSEKITMKPRVKEVLAERSHFLTGWPDLIAIQANDAAATRQPQEINK